MTNPPATTAPATPAPSIPAPGTDAGRSFRSYPAIDRLFTRCGYPEIGPDDFGERTRRAGHTLLLFLEDPVRYKETLDLAVIAPEIVAAFPGRLSVGVLLPEAARALHPRYGFRRWPAMVMLRDGDYVGVIDGLRNWDEYVAEVARLLDAPVARPPSIGIAVVDGRS